MLQKYYYKKINNFKGRFWRKTTFPLKFCKKKFQIFYFDEQDIKNVIKHTVFSWYEILM